MYSGREQYTHYEVPLLVTESTNFEMSSLQSSIDTMSNQVAIPLRVAPYRVRTSDLADRFLRACDCSAGRLYTTSLLVFTLQKNLWQDQKEVGWILEFWEVDVEADVVDAEATIHDISIIFLLYFFLSGAVTRKKKVM